ncbi:helix-turn-helix transcriptional regulator [Rhizobium sp. PAMB 3182]
MEAALTTAEFFRHIKRENGSVRLLSKGFEDSEPMMSGRFGKIELRAGLSVHFSNIINHYDMETEAELEPHLSIKLLMGGLVEGRIGDRTFAGADDGCGAPRGVIFAQREPEIFRRRVAKGERITKFNISILPEWLSDCGILADGGAEEVATFCREHLACTSWKPSAGALALAERAMRPRETMPHMHRLYVESCVLPIIAEAFEQLSGRNGLSERSKSLSIREWQKLTKAEELVANARGSLPTVEEMAAAINVSVNTLQRFFHAAYGMTAYQYMRTVKLTAAQKAMIEDGVTISEAAFLAGYTSAANFSTAFKRQFGYTPGSLRNKGLFS